MKTAYILLAQYESAIIPIEKVRRDYFGALSMVTFLRKLGNGEIPLPLVRMDGSQKGPKGVHVADLAAYIDKCAEVARKEARKLA